LVRVPKALHGGRYRRAIANHPSILEMLLGKLLQCPAPAKLALSPQINELLLAPY
jgi:hypothetical protein